MSNDSVRSILHVDMDAFFVSVELRRRPELRGLPVVVGGTGARGVVAAASYEARRFGIHSAMPSTRARRVCPQLVFLAGDHELYAQVSSEVHEIFQSFTPYIEPLSLDEAFLDVTGATRLLGVATQIANDIRERIWRQLELRCSVGVAPNKFLAKLASDLKKPDGFVVITEQNKQEILDPLGVGRIWGVGKVTETALHSRGIRTIANLRATPEVELRGLVGNGATELLRLARGEMTGESKPPDRPRAFRAKRPSPPTSCSRPCWP